MSISPLAVVNKFVQISSDSVIEDYVVLGSLSEGENEGLETILGKNCLIRSHSVIYAGNRIGDFFQTGHGVLIREFNTIGNHVGIGTHSVIEHHTKIGNNVRIHTSAFIPEYSVIENDAWIGPHVVLTNAVYPASPATKAKLMGPHILQQAKIGANATILPGITIGVNALVGAGSVVTHNVPHGKVVAGNPAKVIGDIADIPDYANVLGFLEPGKGS